MAPKKDPIKVEYFPVNGHWEFLIVWGKIRVNGNGYPDRRAAKREANAILRHYVNQQKIIVNKLPRK